MFEPNAAALRVKLAKVLQRGAAIVPRMAPALRRDIDGLWLAQIDAWLQIPPTSAPVVSAWPLVTLCIPTRNRAALLAQALGSIEQQDYPAAHMQVLVVDDCSTDAGANMLSTIAQELAHRFHPTSKVVFNTRRRHDSGSRNACADFAAGEFLLFLDSDNVATPNYVRTAVQIGSRDCTQVSTLVHAMLHRGADYMTCGLDEFASEVVRNACDR